MKHRLPKNRRYSDFPVSRDYEEIDCEATGCKYNRYRKCMTPSIAIIDHDGKCKGFLPFTVEKVGGRLV
jgi:hypothetical protein